MGGELLSLCASVSVDSEHLNSLRQLRGRRWVEEQDYKVEQIQVEETGEGEG